MLFTSQILFGGSIEVDCEEKGVWHVWRVSRSHRKKQFGRHNQRWEDNIKMDLTEVEWKVVDWIHLGQNSNYW